MRLGVAITITIGMMLLFSASAFGQLRLVPMKYSKVKLINGKHAAVADLENDMSDGTLPGNPPHKYRVLFTTQKDGFYYLVANVQSHSPITSPTAPCGGDSPQSIIWIKADKTLKTREIKSEIYASCSYNYYGSKVRTKNGKIRIDYGGRDKKTLTYDNTKPEAGLIVETMVEEWPKK